MLALNNEITRALKAKNKLNLKKVLSEFKYFRSLSFLYKYMNKPGNRKITSLAPTSGKRNNTASDLIFFLLRLKYKKRENNKNETWSVRILKKLLSIVGDSKRNRMVTKKAPSDLLVTLDISSANLIKK